MRVSRAVEKFLSAEISCVAGRSSHSVQSFSHCRTQRHSDGLFTSEYSKMRGNAQVQKFIQNLMGRKRRNDKLLFIFPLPTATRTVMPRKLLQLPASTFAPSADGDRCEGRQMFLTE
ncbi:UNVERIFIED_CONTAM: hypothetical protein H355_000024, partial [Colinus virginianus]